MKIASDAYRFLIAGLLICLILLVLILAWRLTFFVYFLTIAILLEGFILFFFRDPDRHPPEKATAILAPADGQVIAIDDKVPEYLAEYKTRLSIFLSLLDVHINRLPIGGRVRRAEHQRGRFLAAYREHAVDLNEHTIIEIENNYGRLGFCQRAGAVARRIICHLKVGQNVDKGARFGLIRFGSRLDLYLPANAQIVARLGQHVRGGETIIGEFVKSET